MYRCILVPVDGTAFGEQAIPHAVAIARRSGAVLHLVHVHLPPIVPTGAETAALPPVWIEASWEEKSHYLDRLAADLSATAGIRIETKVLEGAVAGALERHAVRCSAGLIVMSTHGHVGISRLWHHGVADQLARDLPLPVVLVRADSAISAPLPGAGEKPDLESVSLAHFLVPLDGSADSELILEHAAKLARPCGARLTLVRVLAPEDEAAFPGRDGSESSLPTQVLQRRAACRQYLNGLAERLRAHGMEVVTEVLVGEDVAGAVLSHVRSTQDDPRTRVDLIAIEAPHRRAVARILFRGTADDVIRSSPVPVLLFEGEVPRRDVPQTSGLTLSMDPPLA